jgi:hypothetical protein
MGPMLTCQSPRKVMWMAYRLAQQCLPHYSSKFSRHDFTLRQLFACLVVKEHQGRSYRQAEALLQDCPSWTRAIGLKKVPDHNTLCRAAKVLLTPHRVNRVLDLMVQLAGLARALGLSLKPLVLDTTYYEAHHVSRHYEKRCQKTRRRMQAQKGRQSSRSRTVRGLPKLAVAVAAHCHLILAMEARTGMGADHRHFQPLLRAVRRRVPHRRFTVGADAGFDAEAHHELARDELGLRSYIPAAHGGQRPPEQLPKGRWRRHMTRQLATLEKRQSCGYTQRAQDETVHSMMKRNLGSALRGQSPASRLRDLRLKGLTHDVMVLK